MLTFVVELDSGVLGVQTREQLLGGDTVRAVRLGEDDDCIVVDQALGAGCGGGHGGG